ncbi:MAG: hypothetical protein ACE5FC_00285 [Myxococcota bacterium]
MRARIISAFAWLLIAGCAETLTYESIGANGAPMLTEHWRGRQRPFVGNRDVDREARLIAGDGFENFHAGRGERFSCWWLDTPDGSRYTAEGWTVAAALRDYLLLERPGKEASRVVDAAHLRWIEAASEFDVHLHEHTIRATRIARDGEGLRVTDYFGNIHRPGPGELTYTPPKEGPAPVVFGFDREGNLWPLDFPLLRGFVEGRDSSDVVLGTYRTLPRSGISRWHFEKEWGPWSHILSPYLAMRWVFTNKDYVARCEQFP